MKNLTITQFYLIALFTFTIVITSLIILFEAMRQAGIINPIAAQF